MKVVVESRPFFAKKCAKNSKSSQACYEGKAYIAVVPFIHRHQMHGVGPLTMTNFVEKILKISIIAVIFNRPKFQFVMYTAVAPEALCDALLSEAMDKYQYYVHTT